MRSFFFSSRRRHTISDRDWSSDVCSSDLLLEFDRRSRPRRQGQRPFHPLDHVRRAALVDQTQVAEAALRRVRDRKSGVWGKRVDLGGRRIIKKKKETSLRKSLVDGDGDGG